MSIELDECVLRTTFLKQRERSEHIKLKTQNS